MINIHKLLDEIVNRVINEASQGTVGEFYRTNAQDRFMKAFAKFGTRSGYPKTLDELIDTAFRIDPTPNKQYTRWLIEGLLTGNLLPEDLSSLNDLLVVFSTNSNKPSLKGKNNIYNYKTKGDLVNLLQSTGLLEYKSQAFDKKQLDEAEANGDIKFLGYTNQKGWLVYQILTANGSCFLGKNTEWCTAKYELKDKRNMYRHYAKQAPLIVFIKNGEGKPDRIQIHFGEEEFSAMDENDNPVELTEIPEILQFVRNQLTVKDHKKHIEFESELEATTRLGSIIAGNPKYENEDTTFYHMDINSSNFKPIRTKEVTIRFQKCLIHDTTLDDSLLGNARAIHFQDSKVVNCTLNTERIGLGNNVSNCKILGNVRFNQIHGLWTKCTFSNIDTITSFAKCVGCYFDNITSVSIGNCTGTTFVNCGMEGLGHGVVNQTNCTFIGCDFTRFYYSKFTNCKSVNCYAKKGVENNSLQFINCIFENSDKLKKAANSV